MRTPPPKKPARMIGAMVLFVLLAALALRAGNFLLVDSPRPSDVILVLAGETNHRLEHALQLLQEGYGRRIVLDVPSAAKIYIFSQTDLAQKYIQELPQGSAIGICPILGLSTKDESKDAQNCLAREGAKSVLIVTSDFHTRRALSVFRRELPAYDYSVGASRDETQFGVHWWKHRQWAKVFFDEWLRLLWWKTVDQW